MFRTVSYQEPKIRPISNMCVIQLYMKSCSNFKRSKNLSNVSRSWQKEKKGMKQKTWLILLRKKQVV